MNEELVNELRQIGEVRLDEPLARHTTFGIGGPADVYVVVRSAEELARAFLAGTRRGLRPFILGSGSNILVGDGGIRGLVIQNEATAVVEIAGEGDARRFRAESGASFAGVARRFCKQGLAGLEWASGIPGTFGGAVVYNAGAYGGCLADVLHRVRLVSADSDDRWLDAAELGLVYRGSVFTRGQFEGQCVLEVEFSLRESDPAELLERVKQLDTKRLGAQPRGRNAGSIFKNPAEHPAWWLIDRVGLRGAREGGAQISEKHANFFLNTGAARAADVKKLIDEAERLVADRFGVRLEREVALVGEGF
jgi:UDP-N-acetylmuramate dehydrogenase